MDIQPGHVTIGSKMTIFFLKTVWYDRDNKEEIDLLIRLIFQKSKHI